MIRIRGARSRPVRSRSAAKLADPSRRHGLKTNLPREGLITSFFDQIVITQVIDDQLRHLEGMTLRKAGERDGKDPVDVMCDLAVDDNVKTEFYAPAINRDPALMKEIIDYPYITFSLRRRRAYQVPHRRPLPDRGNRNLRA
jgi:hypothetical protein